MQLALIVTLIAIGATVLVGVLGYLIDKNADPADPVAGGIEASSAAAGSKEHQAESKGAWK